LRSPGQLLHQQPAALKLIQLELDGSDFLGRLRIGSLDRPKDFTLAANEHNAEAALHPGGELGGGILGWRATTETSAGQILLHTGNILPSRDNKQSLYEVMPSQKVETPISFIALAKGDADDAGNEAFRYLKRFVFLESGPIRAVR
jgi:hypothetical protein